MSIPASSIFAIEPQNLYIPSKHSILPQTLEGQSTDVPKSSTPLQIESMHSLHLRARPMFKNEMYRCYEILILAAASHLVPNTFSPRTFGSPQLVPKNKQSPNRPIWSPWTYGPQDKWSPWTNLLVVSKFDSLEAPLQSSVLHWHTSHAPWNEIVIFKLLRIILQNKYNCWPAGKPNSKNISFWLGVMMQCSWFLIRKAIWNLLIWWIFEIHATYS